jgi:hypothetical protein
MTDLTARLAQLKLHGPGYEACDQFAYVQAQRDLALDALQELLYLMRDHQREWDCDDDLSGYETIIRELRA